VHTAQGRLSGYILALLPPVVGAAIFALNPDYILTLFRDPAGKVMLVTACLLQVLGYLWIRRIVNVEI
jgi:tight adherence protein B